MNEYKNSGQREKPTPEGKKDFLKVKICFVDFVLERLSVFKANGDRVEIFTWDPVQIRYNKIEDLYGIEYILS